MADKQNVGGIEVTADVDLGPLNEKLDQLSGILKTFDKRKFTVTGDLKGSFFKDLDQAIQKLAAGAKAPVQLDAASNAAAKLQDQIDKINNLEAKVSSFTVVNGAEKSIQAYLDSQKFTAKISSFEVDEGALGDAVQAALTGRKFKLDVDIGEVTGSVSQDKKASASAKAAATTPTTPSRQTPQMQAATAAAQAAGIDPQKIVDAITKAIAAYTTGSAPTAKTAAAKTEAARGTSNTVSPTAFGLRADASPAATWAARTGVVPAVRQQLQGGGRISYVGFGKDRYDLPREQPGEPRGFRFSKSMAAARPDIAMVLADAGVQPGQWAPKEAAFQVGSILLQEQQEQARDAVLKAIYRSAMDPYAVAGGAGGLKRMGDRVVRRGFHGRRPVPRGAGKTPTFGGGRAELNAGPLTEPSTFGPARMSRMPTPRTAWHAAEGVQYDEPFIEKVTGLIQGTGGAEANWQQAREELRPRMTRLVENVVASGRNPREFFAGIRRSLGNQIQEGGKIQDIGPEMGPLELEAITLTGLYNSLRSASETRTGGRVNKREGRYGIAGTPMGVHETGIVTPGWIPRDLTEAAASSERYQFSGRATSARSVARKAKSTRRKALAGGVVGPPRIGGPSINRRTGEPTDSIPWPTPKTVGLGIKIAEKGVDKRPETGLISARGKLFEKLFKGDAWKRIEQLRNLESTAASEAVRGYATATGTEEVDPAIEDALRTAMRKHFVAALPEEEADLYTKAQGIPLSAEDAKAWRTNEVGRAKTAEAEATAFDERHGRKRRTRRTTAAAEPTPAGTVTDLSAYRATRNKRTGAIMWHGPRGLVSQKNVPAERVAEEMHRIGEVASGTGGSARPPREVLAGGGKGGAVDVNVKNFSELGRLLSGTTNTGGLKKGIGADLRGIAEQIKNFEGTPEEGAAKFAGGDMEKFQRILRGEEAPEEAGAAAPRSPIAMMPVTPAGAKPAASPWTSAMAAYDREVRRMTAETQKEAAAVQKEMDAAAKGKAAPGPIYGPGRAEFRQVKVLQREEEARRKAAAPKPKAEPTAKNIDNPEDDLLKYAAKTGYKIAPSMGAAGRREMAQQEIAQTYGQFNLQRQMMPERAPGVAFAQVFARLTGVKGRMEDAAKARSAAEGELLTAKELRIADQGRLEAVQKVRAALKESIGTNAESMRAAGQSRTEISTALATQSRYYRESIAQEKALTDQVQSRSDAEGKATEHLKETDSALAKAGGKMASFAQIGALFVGAKAFMVFNQALDETFKLAMDVGGKAVDQLLGFQATNDRVTKSLAQQIVALNGNTTAAMGTAAAMAGLSDAGAKYVQGAVQPNAMAMAGAAKNVQASDMFRAAAYRDLQQNRPYGGFAPGLFEGTGGLLGGPILAEQMGGQPGVLKRVVDDLSFYAGVSKQEKTFEENIHGPTAPAAETLASITAGPLKTGQKQYVDDLNAAMARGAARMGRLSEVSGEVAGQFQVLGTTADDVSEPMKAAMLAAGKALGQEDKLQELIDSGIGISGLEGKSQYDQGQVVGKALENLALGRNTPDAQQYMNIQKQQLMAQLTGIEMQRSFQADFVMPAEVALERIMNPPVPATAGTEALVAAMPTGTKEEQAAKAALTTQMGATAAYQQETQAQQARPEAILKIISPEDRPAAEGLLQSITSMTAEMLKLQEASATLASNLQAAQYANQRRIMNRELQDALALAGKVGDAHTGNLGVLQRQQVLLDRQNQALSLQAQQLSIMLTQRQINFQIAVAGFQAPGVTGEERHARIEQAKIEAAYAQKQLDIQKQQAKIAQKSYRLNIKVFDETVARQITDLRKGLGLLDKSYSTNIEITLNEKKLAEIDKRRQTVAKQLTSYISKGIEIQNTMISVAVTAAATITGSVGAFYSTVTRMTNTYFTGVAQWMEAIANGEVPGSNSGGGEAFGGGVHPQAEGYLGTVHGATKMIMGEAGDETVAILRNPRETSATPMSGGGGVTVVINVTGNSIRDDRDIDLLTDRIERKLNMKASLLGFRKPV